MKFKDILDKKVLYSENLGDEYYYDYRIIVQINENEITLIEYNDSYSGYIPFFIESVDKEFISSYFDNYEDEKTKIKLDFNSDITLKDCINFEDEEKYLEEEIIILNINDIKDYIEGGINYE